MLHLIALSFVTLGTLVGTLAAEESKPVRILFLGDAGHHQPVLRYRMLQPVLAKRGIELEYTDTPTALNKATLARFDGLLVYANIDAITPDQEAALLEYVAGGKGFIPVHCASYCFRNSPKYVELVGAQFVRHGTGVFRTETVAPNHPLMQGFMSFSSWDETYVHTKHNEKDRTVLEVRTDGTTKEPWTWVRTHGQGRVFYTAWGHDERTWTHPGFHNLIERGIRWATQGDLSKVPAYLDAPTMTAKRTDLPRPETMPGEVPFYPPGERWGTTAEPIRQIPKPLPPRESMKHLVHPTDFTVELFASEPELGGKPIAMNWDERGRLWVAITVDYPNDRKPEGEGRDRILICEDTNGDGKADKFTVFADKLSVPTSLAFSRGGVIVLQMPHTLFLKDTTGDDRADVREVLFTGWGTSDTHAGPSNLRYGLDNWFYGIVGYSAFDGTVGGVRHRFGQGIFRFAPDGQALEFLRSTNNNSWGLGISEEGHIFGSTANGCPSVHLAIPNRYYERVRGWSPTVLASIALENKFHPITDKVRQVDWHGGFTAGAGHALYTARTYPSYYWNRTAFVNEPTGHLAATFVLQPYGTHFIARYGWNLLASTDEWTSPIVSEVGPDGNVWCIDWYNYIVQHNPTPAGYKTGRGNAYETPLRDKHHGRIYRLVAKAAKPEPPLTLKDASPDTLVATLKHPNQLWRLHAQRLLIERGKTDVVPKILDLTSNQDVDGLDLNVGAIHALWTLRGLGVLDTENGAATAALFSALRHRSAAVRKNAVQALPATPLSAQILAHQNLFNDPDAHVRLATLLSTAALPTNDHLAQMLLEGFHRPENLTDRWLPDGLTAAAAAHALPFLKAVARDAEVLPERALAIVRRVAEHYARGGPKDSVGELIAALTASQPRNAEAILAGLAAGWPATAKVDTLGVAAGDLQTIFARLSTESKGHLLRLGSRWGNDAFQQQALAVARDLLAKVNAEDSTDTERLRAVKQMIELRPGDVGLRRQLFDLITPRLSPALAAGIIDAQTEGANAEVAAEMLRRWPQWTPGLRANALRVLLGRTETLPALLAALESGTVAFTELTLDQKQLLANHPDDAIAARAKALLAKGGGLPNADRVKVIEEFIGVTKTVGNPGLGKAVFVKHCAVCHKHGDEGNLVGPDLTGMAVHPKEELLVHILDPNRSVEGNYRQYLIETTDGKLLSGMLAAETRTTLEVIDSQGKRHVVVRADIEQFQATTKSLMPEGFEKQMTAEELTNLLEFLTQRGKYVPIPLNKYATVTSAKGMFYDENNAAERLVFDDWKPKFFAGVPFVLVDPQGGRVLNAILLRSSQGTIPPRMPQSVMLPCNTPAVKLHFLGGVSGWGHPLGAKGSISMIVRLHYADGTTEEHPLLNGEHLSDYIRRVDVPKSQFAFNVRGRQLRYLAIEPKRPVVIDRIELVKGPDTTAPLVMAVTIETAAK